MRLLDLRTLFCDVSTAYFHQCMFKWKTSSSITNDYRSCGHLSTADLRRMGGGMSSGIYISDYCVASSTTTITNWCQTTPYINEDGTAGGETVFVSTGCSGNQAPLEFCFQSQTYCLPGVSKNASIYDDQIKAHENWDESLPYESTPVESCKQGHWPPKPPVG